MKLELELTDDMAKALEKMAKRNMVGVEHVALTALSAFAARDVAGTKEPKLFGIGLGELGQIIISIGQTLSDISETKEGHKEA